MRVAAREIGKPYRWGADTPSSGFDCSGLVVYALGRLGIAAPRTSEDQYAWSSRVAASDLQPGDLVFMNFPGEASPGHVMIYAGGGQVIQAPHAGADVQEVPFRPQRAGARVWGGRLVGYGRVPGLGGTGTDSATLEQLWIRAGGPPNVAKIMAAIALAESGGRVNARNRDANGTSDYGLWQINSSHGYNSRKLLTSPTYNAQAAVSVYRSQGLTAWATYTSGAYRAFLANAPGAIPLGRPPRPGAAGTGGGDGSGTAAADTSAAQQAAWGSYLSESDSPPQVTAGGPQTVGFGGWLKHNILGGGILGPFNPLSPFEDAQAAVSDLGTFLKWIAWLFAPRNILRVVEFNTGAGLMVVGIVLAVKGYRSGGGRGSSYQPRRRRILRTAALATPVGRALEEAGAVRSGRRAARSSARRETLKRARKRGELSEKQAAVRRRNSARRQDEIPF